MKLILNLSLFLFALIIFSDESYSLTYYQMKKFCEKEKKPLNCQKNLRKKKYTLDKGYQIEIPVIHHSR